MGLTPYFSGMGLVLLEQFGKIYLMKSIGCEIYFILTSVDWVVARSLATNPGLKGWIDVVNRGLEVR